MQEKSYYVFDHVLVFITINQYNTKQEIHMWDIKCLLYSVTLLRFLLYKILHIYIYVYSYNFITYKLLNLYH